MKRMRGWGVTGWSDSWQALGSDLPDDDDPEAVTLDGYGVERTVDPGVIYAPLPDVPGVPRWHAKPRKGGRILQMTWPEDVEPTTRSLLDLQSAIASRRGTLTSDDPDLLALDAGVEMLVSAAAALHAAGRSVGFLQPDSCRVGTWRDGRPFIALPDVGFAWDKRSGLMIPRWISEPALELLFEGGAERRNEDCLAENLRAVSDDRDIHQRASAAAASDLADVKILARLVAASLVGADEVRRWCGGKKCLTKLPSKEVARDTQAEIWDKVIAPALEGQVRTCDELKMRLAACKPSSHFLHVPPTPPWVGWAVLRRSAVVVAAACLLGLLWMVSDDVVKWIVGEPAPFCRVVPKTNPLYGKLVVLKESRDRARGDAATRPEFWGHLRECLVDHAAPETCGGRCLAGLVDEWLAEAEEEGRAVRERLRSRPQPTPDEVRDIAAAIAAIRQAEGEAKRSETPSVVPVLERELRLRGGAQSWPSAEKNP
jgi:hypothetical protein